MKKRLIEYSILFILGGLIYGLIEIMARVYTHWSMVLVGGLCFLIVGALNEVMSWDLAITSQMLIGAISITIIEFIAGCILNLWLGWNIWDYSELPYNLLGQICLTHSCYWFLLSLAAILVDDYCRYWFFKEEKPKYKL